MKALDLTGQRFGRLVAKSRGPANKFKHSTWHCVCDCGTETVTETQKLRSGHSQSCGCAFRETIGKVQLRHGACVGGLTAEYNAWSSAVDRCENPNAECFPNYGGRGIRMSPEWRTDFANFLADMGKRPKGTTLDRIDVNGHYERGNCRWATPAVQARNKRNNIYVALEDGTKVILKDFARMHGVDYHCMYARHVRGQPLLK